MKKFKLEYFLMAFVLGFIICTVCTGIQTVYKKSTETKCDKDYDIYSNYMYIVNLQAISNGFGEHPLYTKKEFCKIYEI